LITLSTENNHKNEKRGVRKPTKHDYVINGESLAHAVRGFGCENNKHTLFPNMFMDHYLQIEYDLHILNLAMSFDATYYKKFAKK
jgi:hypothetical protein